MDSQLQLFFSDQGLLADIVPGFRRRDAQLEMAQLVSKTLAHRNQRSIIEAGTGTGKSYAYLVPALLSNQKVLIATGTKTLQDQLYEKDIPAVLEAVFRHTGEEKSVAIMKGRQNYLCLTRYDRFQAAPQFLAIDDNQFGKTLNTWARATSTGDRNEIPGLPDDFRTWRDLDAGSDTCIGQKCPQFSDCYITRMRQKAEEADVIIVNQHLLCADLRVRLDAQDRESGEADLTQSFGQVIPDTDAIIIDEAHRFPDTATQYFGVTFSVGKTRRLHTDVQRVFRTASKQADPELMTRLHALSDTAEEILNRLVPSHLPSGKVRLSPGNLPTGLEASSLQMQERVQSVTYALKKTKKALEEETALSAEIQGLIRRTEQVGDEISFLLNKGITDPSFVAFVENHNRNMHVGVAPVNIALPLQKTLFAREGSLVFTSATLAVAGNTKAFCERIGLQHSSTKEKAESQPNEPSIRVHHDRLLPSPFDYETQAALYLPPKMPEPSSNLWQKRLESELLSLAQLTDGGALFLFTSHRCLSLTYDHLLPTLSKSGFQVYRQGNAPKQQIVESFKRNERGIVMATHSFWEGLDIPGEALRLVAVDRLPFRSPEDPLYAARSELARADGNSPFNAFGLPEAALALKQGLGRLLRNESDRGITTVLDGRIQSRRYGNVFIQTLPAFKKVTNFVDLQAWWGKHGFPTNLENKQFHQGMLGIENDTI
jgi:ATP-dependent DNA helicase DinG